MIEKVKIKNLSTGFRLRKGDEKILHRNLNFSIQQGEMVCILGPNGAGKSTLLKTMLGFAKPISGEIFFGDQNLNDLSVKELSKIVSIVLTEKIEDFYLTAYEVVMTGRLNQSCIDGNAFVDG